MIPTPTPNQVWLVVEPIDMRAGIDGLSQRIQNTLGCSPCDGSAYAFRNRRLTRLKLLVWDGTGVWLCQRRLHRGQFVEYLLRCQVVVADLKCHNRHPDTGPMGLADRGG